MNYKLLIISLLIFSTFNLAFTQSISIKEAEKVAIQFYFKQYNLFNGEIIPEKIQIKESFSIEENGKDVLFIFNFSSEGFAIVPAEKAMDPILGFSFEGAYDLTSSSANFNSWLQIYKNQVSHISQNKFLANKKLNNKWKDLLQNKFTNDPLSKSSKDVEPLLTSFWNQDFPYNIYCPENSILPGGYSYVGPVGVAMGQIMYYWRYPLTGTGSISYYVYPIGTISVNFGETTYSWEGMSDEINFSNPNPIAQLLFHCAASVSTNFGTTGSGAYSADVPNALTNYFGYDGSCEYIQKLGISLSVWKQMLKDDLDILQPVYYSGISTEGGHAFVVDGYQESDDDYFHINFGWSGDMNGYYLITDAGGFTSQQAMVRNIFPGGDYPYYCQGSDTITFLRGTIDDGSGFTFDYENNANCNWLLSPQGNNDSISGLIINFSNFQTESGNDVVTIYDGPTNAYPVLGSYSGSTLPPQLISSDNKVLVNFSTNSTITEPGWLLSFESLYPEFCTTLQTYTSITDTISDGSGSFYYQNGTNCMWMLVPPGATEITFYFNSFETEEDQDWVKIYDASNNMLLAEYSGMYQQGNPPPPVISPSGEMLITFESDLIYNAPGWEGVYVMEGWLPPPTSLTIHDSIYSLDITWSIPDTSLSNSTFLGYNLFKNGTQINSSLITDTTFIDAAGPGEFEYCVTAVYEDGESNPVCASIFIPCYGTLELTVFDTISGQGVDGITVNIGDTAIVSGINGYAEIMLPEGSYNITISVPGYDPVYSSCDIICDTVTTMELLLHPIFPPPQNVDAEIIDESIVYCSWETADTLGVIYNLLGYNVYRNDTLLNATLIVGTFYYDLSFYLANHEYCVTSVYEVSESIMNCDEVVVESGGFEGNVYNIYTNIPVPGSIVSLGNYSDTTNASGNFYIYEIPVGSYEVNVTAENYNPLPSGFNVEIIDGSIETADIPLDPLFLNTPMNLQFEVLNPGEGVKLFWSTPLPHPWILEGYNVYLREWGVGDFELINEELVTDTLFIDTEAGGSNNNEYYVTTVFNAGESQGSNIVFVIIPGIDKLPESIIKIFPNPANDKICINFHESHKNNKCELTLYNYLGENSLTKNITSIDHDLIMLDITNLQKGIYILDIKFEDFNFSEKIIVQ